MKKLGIYFTNKINELLDYLMKNTIYFGKKYINEKYIYGRELPFQVKSARIIKESQFEGLFYITVKSTNNKERLCLIDNKSIKCTSYDWEDIEEALNDDVRVFFTTSKLEKFENNNIIPQLVVKVSINGDTQ